MCLYAFESSGASEFLRKGAGILEPELPIVSFQLQNPSGLINVLNRFDAPEGNSFYYLTLA
jgi:hypothetical protein